MEENVGGKGVGAQRKEVLLEWLAQFSTEHEDELRRLRGEEAEARRKREQLEWLARISTEHERQLRTLLWEEAEARESQQRSELISEAWTAQEQWDPSKHPRLGRDPNAGWFATTGTTGGASSVSKPVPVSQSTSAFRTASYRVDGSTPHVMPAGFKRSKNKAASPPASAHASSASQRPPDRSREEAARSSAGESRPDKDVRTYFELLYGDKGQKLLKAFEKSGALLQIQTPRGAKSALYQRTHGNPPRIWLSPDLNPAEAAQERMERLIEASGLTTVRFHLDHSGFANIEILKDSYRQSVKQSAAAVALAAELYLSGISIANEYADLVITLHELSEGNYYAAIGLLPILPASIGRTGVVLKHGQQTLRLSSEQIRGIKALPVQELIDLLESTRTLARNMEKAALVRPAGTAAHHIVPAALKKFPEAESARNILKRFNIDVQNAANGVYLPSTFNNAVKAAYHGNLHTKAYFKEIYRRLASARSKEQVLITLDQIRKDLLKGTFPR